jgi:hypothetical protein
MGEKHMSQWEDLYMVKKITEILESYRYDEPEKTGGHPYVTAYQIAFDFAEKHPDDVRTIGFPIGGKGTGERNSLAQYIAGELSRGISAKRISHIERAFLHTHHISNLSFRYGDDVVEASTPESQYHFSMYRLKA